jgi:hypothetical protein
VTGTRVLLAAVLAGSFLGRGGSGPARETAPAPEVGVERPAPPALEDFETDKNRDGVPDGWYNLRDARVVDEGGVVGSKYLKFESAKPGRGARLSRAFGIDGKKHEAVVIGLWVRLDQIQAGERMGEDPGLHIDFLGDKLRQETRGSLGPWTVRAFGAASHWTRVSKRIPVPPATKDAIMTLGLLGATGVLDIDGLTIDLVPVGGETTTNLVKNPDFELGDPDPAGWLSDNGAHRAFPGFRSNAALELAKSGSRCMTGLALPVEPFAALSVSLKSRGQGLRGSGGAGSFLFFIGEDGRVLPEVRGGVPIFNWSGTFDWQEEQVVVPVPRGSARAVLQFEKKDGLGSIRLDDVIVTALPNPEAGSWTPYHVIDETERWQPVSASTGIEPKSALDFSFLLEGPAGKAGAITTSKAARLSFSKGGRARFFGVQLLPPGAFLDTNKADALADRLARSGVNLVRLGNLDAPLGPALSLLDDSRDDTKEFDATALARLDHLIAALKKRGIYVAIELQGDRRFRADDGVAMPGALPPGGGPAAIFDPVMTKLVSETSRALLRHVNPETGLALKNDPALAWVTLSGEVSLFNLIDDPTLLPGDYAKAYRDLTARSTTGIGRRFWQGLESAHWKELADALRKDGLRVPVAGVSHWRRELEFSEEQAAPGLDLIDDRIFWAAPTWIAPRWRSALRSLDGGLIADASKKRRPDRPYVVGQWCDYTQGVWAFPYEAAEQLLAAQTARSEDWDGLVRRGVFLYPEAWGSSAPGTAGVEDIFQLPEVANAAPQVFALWPHQASIYLRGDDDAKKEKDKGLVVKNDPGHRQASRAVKHSVPGWDADRGRLVIDTPFTEGVAGWPGEDAVTLGNLIFDIENTYGVVVASSAGTEPLSRTKRLLVTAIARVTPTGFRWVDEWKRETADPGRPPLLAEPVKGTVTWRRKGTIKAYALDNNGNRLGPAKLRPSDDGATLVLDGSDPAFHWELILE